MHPYDDPSPRTARTAPGNPQPPRLPEAMATGPARWRPSPGRSACWSPAVYAPPVVAYAPPVAAAYVGPAYVPPCPGPGFVWTAGFYGPGRVWHAGYWGRPYGAAFVGPHYVARGYRGWRR